MTDIVERLRDGAWYIADEVTREEAKRRDLMDEAADEIETLRAVVEKVLAWCESDPVDGSVHDVLSTFDIPDELWAKVRLT